MITNIRNMNNELPVDLNEAKNHLGVYHNEDDEYIQSLIAASVAHAEGITNRKLSVYEITEMLDVLSGLKHLRYGNNKSIIIRSDNTIIDSINYQYGIDSILVKSTIKNVTLIYQCGYTVDDCPADIKAAILLLVSTLYESRLDISIGVQQFKSHLSSTVLLNKYKLY